MYAKLRRSAAIRGQLDKVTPHRGDSHNPIKTHTQALLHIFFLFFLVVPERCSIFKAPQKEFNNSIFSTLIFLFYYNYAS